MSWANLYIDTKAKEAQHRKDLQRVAKHIGVSLKVLLKWRREGNLSDKEVTKIVSRLPIESDEVIVVERRRYFG